MVRVVFARLCSSVCWGLTAYVVESYRFYWYRNGKLRKTLNLSIQPAVALQAFVLLFGLWLCIDKGLWWNGDACRFLVCVDIYLVRNAEFGMYSWWSILGVIRHSGAKTVCVYQLLVVSIKGDALVFSFFVEFLMIYWGWWVDFVELRVISLVIWINFEVRVFKFSRFLM